MTLALDERETALLEVGRELRVAGYEFTTVTPETHRRVLARPGSARSLRDVFGWNRAFDPAVLPRTMFEALGRADALEPRGALVASRVRFATLAGELYAHSAYPTLADDAVFFGPDSYRFCRVLARTVQRAARVVDLGCGSGVGGLSLATRVDQIVLADINAAALSLARVNAHLAGSAAQVEIARGDLFAGIAGPIDLVIANPPYLADHGQRAYRDGGGELGTALGVRIVRDSLARLSPGGQLVLYTGAPIVDGRDVLRAAIAPLLDRGAVRWTYEELDPDVFGEELDQRAYANVERIAAVAICAGR